MEGTCITRTSYYLRYKVYEVRRGEGALQIDTAILLFPRGHGTYLTDTELRASVAGVVEKVNKLIYVQPLKSRFMQHKIVTEVEEYC